MSDQAVLAQAKKIQSSLKKQRQPVSQVQDAQHEAQAISQFVRAALSPEHRWFIPREQQQALAATFKLINQIFARLYEQCRTPHLFQQQAAKYIAMGKQISHLSHCIHMSLDHGFYMTEPRGISPGNALALSWQEVERIRIGIEEQGRWVRNPLSTPVDDEAKQQFFELHQKASGLVPELLAKSKLKDTGHPLSVEELQAVYKYFQFARKMLELEEQAQANSMKSAPEAEQDSVDSEHLHKQLDQLKQRLALQSTTNANELRTSASLEEVIQTDAQLRLELLYVSLEPIRYLKICNDRMEILCAENLESGIAQFDKETADAQSQLQLIVSALQEAHDVLSQIASVLNNLSISFGKIYNNASARSITHTFLQKTLETIRGLLQKAVRVAQTRQQVLVNLNNHVERSGLFERVVIEGVAHGITLVDESRLHLEEYEERLNDHLGLILQAPDMQGIALFQRFHKAYEERTSLSSACMVLGSVSLVFDQLLTTMWQMQETQDALRAVVKDDAASEAKKTKLTEIVQQIPEAAQERLNICQSQTEELEWMVTEMLDSVGTEERRFLKELHQELEPVRARLKVKEGAAKELASRESTSPATGVVAAQKEKTLSQRLLKHQLHQGATGESHFDPLPSNIMVILKATLKDIPRSRRAKMLLQILTHPHMFFNVLDKLEAQFDPDGDPILDLENDLHESRETIDFLLNFVRLKFLASGYFNPEGQAYPYDAEGRRFEISGPMEKYLKLRRGSFETPKNMFTRLVRGLLGMDEAKLLGNALSEQALMIFSSDFVLRKQEQQTVQDALTRANTPIT